VDAEVRLAEIDEEIARIESDVATAGTRTPAQERELVRLTGRRERELSEIAKLTAELDALPSD
jgi:hypothetical protein